MHSSSKSVMIASNDFIAAADIVIIITSHICTDYGWSAPSGKVYIECPGMSSSGVTKTITGLLHVQCTGIS